MTKAQNVTKNKMQTKKLIIKATSKYELKTSVVYI